MKILYLGFNRSYTNPTAETMIRVIGQIADLDYFGPGFSDQSTLEKGVEKWIDSNGSYDFLMVDSYVFESENIMSRERPFTGDFIRFSPNEFYKYAKSYQDFFHSYLGNKLFVANFDTFGIAQELIDRVIASGAYVLEGGNSVVRSKEVITSLYGSPYSRGNDNWYHFVNDSKQMVISTPHTLSSMEFDFSPLSNRKHHFYVIGAPYGERKEAMKLMTSSQKRSDFKNRLKLWLRGKRIKTLTERQLLTLRSDYMSTISDTKLCYCSGGPWLYPVRKYFEIPARGAVALGWSCSGFEALGFVDGQNYIVAETNEDLQKVIDSYNDHDFQKIAENGRDTIWRLHSDWARKSQLKGSLERIMNATFKGSYWENGEYKHYD